jgi:hypothetical protein
MFLVFLRASIRPETFETLIQWRSLVPTKEFAVLHRMVPDGLIHLGKDHSIPRVLKNLNG